MQSTSIWMDVLSNCVLMLTYILENECMLLMDMMVVVPYEDIFEPLEGLVMFCILILCCVRQEN